ARLPRAHDRGDRRSLLGGALAEAVEHLPRTAPGRRAEASRHIEAVGADPLLRARRQARRRLPPGRVVAQPRRRHAPRRVLLPSRRGQAAGRQQGRRRDRRDTPRFHDHFGSHVMQPLIEMKDASKEYRGVPAVTKVNFVLQKGEIHALLGENGAGKSTLTKMMCGVTQPTSGEMLLNGAPVNFQTPAQALDHGVVMVFQETSLVPSMTVAQNLYLGDESLFNRIRGLNIAAQTFLQSLNFNVNPTALVSSLGAAHKQMVEIARAVRKNVQVIIFDEPTASLTPEEKRHFFALVERLKRNGVSIIFISHALEEALAIADRITVLRAGELVASDLAKNFDRDKIIRAMVGRSLSSSLYRHEAGQEPRAVGEKVL